MQERHIRCLQCMCKGCIALVSRRTNGIEPALFLTETARGEIQVTAHELTFEQVQELSRRNTNRTRGQVVRRDTQFSRTDAFAKLRGNAVMGCSARVHGATLVSLGFSGGDSLVAIVRMYHQMATRSSGAT